MPRWVRHLVYVFTSLVCISAGASCWALAMPVFSANATLAQAQQQWEADRPKHYLLTVRLLTMHSGQLLRLEVRDERIVAGWYGESTSPMSTTDLGKLSAFLPVRQLFVVANKQISRPIQWRETLVGVLPPLQHWLASTCPLRSQPPILFAAGRGYPKRLFIGTSSCAFDHDGMEVRVDQLQSLP